MRPLKVAFVGLRGVPAAYGGVDRVVEDISSGLAARGHEVTVYCWKSVYRERPPEWRGVRLVYLPTVPVKYLGTLVHTLLGCLDAGRKDFDVVHINNTENSLFGFIPRLFGQKVVIQPHGPAWPVLKWGTLRERAVFNLKIRLQRAYLFFCRFTTRWWAHRIVVISGPDADYISRTKSDKFVLIHNACHLPSPERPDRMLGLGIEPRRYVLFVGRFDPRKGGHYLIEAFKGLDTNLKLVFVGGPRDSVYGRFLTRLAGSDPRILFTGPLYDKTLRELFSNAAVYAHPSESEGQSISLLEGLAYGNCVVTSDTPESVETAEDNAYYFRTGDPADLARALRDALSDPEAMERMRARAARHVASAYQWPDKVERYEQLYSSLAG